LRKIIPYYCFVAALLLAACDNNGTRSRTLPSLTETYSKTDKKPFGGYIAYQQLATMYSQNIIRDKKQSFTATWNDLSYSDTASLYVCITPNLYLNDEEATAMMDYVSAGNDLFIAAGSVDEKLLKKISCKESYDFISAYMGFAGMDNTVLSLPPGQAPNYNYFYFPFSNYFYNINKNNTRVLGYNEKNKADFIVCFYGKGRLFLHCDVRAFSNYFLLKNNNYQFMESAFAYTHTYPSHLYWDDYYNKLRGRRNSDPDGGFSSFDELRKHPPLLAAFWLAFILLLLYIIFSAKRRQRIVKIVKPNENTTVAFTETVGLLYLQKKDNKNIAEKMITYFNEYIRNNYFLNTGNINDDFITTLSRKSGVRREKIDALYRTIQHTQQSTMVDDYQLLSLNELIQNFYKNRN